MLGKLTPCPRCSNPAATIDEQIATCSFCAARARYGALKVPEPTEQFPTWKPPHDPGDGKGNFRYTGPGDAS